MVLRGEDLRQKWLFVVMLFECGDRILFTQLEGDDIIRLPCAGELTGNDGRVAAVGAARGRRRLVADELRAARRAGIALHAGLGPFRAVRLGPFALVGSLRGLLLSLFGGLRGLLVLFRVECLDLLDRIGRAAVVAFKLPGRADKVQRAGTRGTFVIRDLICQAVFRLL